MRRREGTPVTLVAAVVLDVCFALFLTVGVAALALAGAHDLGPATAKGVRYLFVAAGYGLLIPFAIGGAYLLARKSLAGSILTYFVAIVAFVLSVGVAFQSGEVGLGSALAAGSVLCVACLVAPPTREALRGRSSTQPVTRLAPYDPSRHLPPALDLKRTDSDVALQLLGGPAFVLSGIWMALSGQLFGWFAVALFGPVSLLGFISFARGAPHLQANEKGLTLLSPFGRKTYGWDRIGPFMVSKSNYISRVVFNKIDDGAGLSVSRTLSGNDGRLPSNFGLGAQELADRLNHWREAATDPGT